MTYKYAMSGSHRATVYRVADDGELVAKAEIDGGNLLQPGNIKSIARATVAALNGAARQPRVVWHPKAVEALRAVNAYWNQGHTWDSETIELRAVLHQVSEALALVDQPPPADKVVGWALMDEGKWPLWASVYESLGEAQRASGDVGRYVRIVRLVEEPTS